MRPACKSRGWTRPRAVVMDKSRTIRVALIGNPNTGKTTLFNRLTGSRQKIGNYPRGPESEFGARQSKRFLNLMVIEGDQRRFVGAGA